MVKGIIADRTTRRTTWTLTGFTATTNMNPYRKQMGKLIQVLPSGGTITLLDNKPWALLQDEKKARIRLGIKEETLKVTNI